MVAVVAVVLSVAVDEAGGEWVRHMSALRVWNVRTHCGRCTCRCRPRRPQAVHTVVVVVPVIGGVLVLLVVHLMVVVVGGSVAAVALVVAVLDSCFRFCSCSGCRCWCLQAEQRT